jgi:hypothetical protein
MPQMAFDIWQRAQAKWRGLLVYVLLEAVMRVVTTFIQQRAESSGLLLYAAAVSIATAIFCLVQEYRLLMTDQEGDDAWPPIWR